MYSPPSPLSVSQRGGAILLYNNQFPLFTGPSVKKIAQWAILAKEPGLWEAKRGNKRG
jgi:hypothetical protein